MSDTFVHESMKDHRDAALELVKRACERGAEEADVYIEEERTLHLDVRLGRVESLQQSESTGVGLRVYRRGASALVYSTRLEHQERERLVDEALAMVSSFPPEASWRLPPESQLGSTPPIPETFDPVLSTLSTERKLELMREVEQTGMSRDPRINNSKGAFWSDLTRRTTLASSHGFVDHYDGTRMSLGVSLLAEENGVKQTDGWYSSSRMFSRLSSPQLIGRKAADRTLRKLGSRKLSTCAVPVVFEAPVASDFLRQLFDAVEGWAVHRRQTYLAERIGQRVGHNLITVVDDATLPGGYGSRPFDGEGVCSQRNEVIRQGELLTFLTDGHTAHRLDARYTGNAHRAFNNPPKVAPNNFYLEPGQHSLEHLLRSTPRGLLVTRLYWVGVNLATGDYSRGAEGIWFEDGELCFPVQEVTIAGNMIDMFERIALIANDLEFQQSVASPSFLTSELVISGA